MTLNLHEIEKAELTESQLSRGTWCSVLKLLDTKGTQYDIKIFADGKDKLNFIDNRIDVSMEMDIICNILAENDFNYNLELVKRTVGYMVGNELPLEEQKVIDCYNEQYRASCILGC